jgi:hypothetical protein
MIPSISHPAASSRVLKEVLEEEVLEGVRLVVH